MVQDSMIEQVADTLNQILNGMKLSEMPQNYRAARMDEATTQILNTIRVPTEAMIVAGATAMLGFLISYDKPREWVADVYIAMIDAARAEKLE